MRELRTNDFSSATPALDAATMVHFERALEETVCVLLAPADSPVAEQVRWHFGIGCDGAHRGKRLRPRLLLQVALNEGGSFDEALDAALAVEYLHNYSLVHDDIEDCDELRHGRQALWARYGVSHGVNAGDSMCAVSYLALLRNSAGAPFGRLAALARVLQKANLRMCVGQSLDIGFESASHVTLEAYMKMIDGKTAVLFGAACELGALCAGADERRAATYGELGRAYGRAYQIRDDVLGTWGSWQKTGKVRAGDIARRKWNFPIVWALGGPASAARAAIAARYTNVAPPECGEIEAIAAALDALGARHAAEEACRAQLHAAEELARRYHLDRDGTVRALFEPLHEAKVSA